ncbi:hypothetical protein H310_13253 [Aphanomyces invadans]|uniref:Uncharacterized protein n=1 Tax=Aphanomyces invadans TaxID=157072 RepID=A0A024TE81_9STRA|nr:hypothetical protein H310_13253 [Aphanomyces invadans]ETV92353.1 hypothetical protein H310_13253 [Aphanomyces invadans]|eukprot:XP_008878904.1 hypothetical protein H310_13253 [Aphanomyces invadans]
MTTMELSEVDKLLAEDSDGEDMIDVNDLEATLTLEEILNEDLEATSLAQVSTTATSTVTVPTENPLLHRTLSSRSRVSMHKPSTNASTSNSLKTPLDVAKSLEEILLEPPREMLVSPLAVKRRMRSNNHYSSVIMQQRKKDKTHHHGGSAGVVKVEPMQIISKQLVKNAEFRDNGPGSPTVVAIHPKFIAIGTSKSLVLVFDHFQNIRHVLRNTASFQEGSSEPYSDGPVTAIDVSPGSDFLVCGYHSGRIVLWDMLKGTALKVVSDAHECPVVSLLFLKDQKPCILSVDANGIANKVNFSKMMGYVYVVDVDPIYDGSAGKILSVAILAQSAGHMKIAHITDVYSIAAISTDKVTFLVAIEPEVKVLHRWFKPEGVTVDNLPSLAFAWVALPGSSRHDTPTPILARGWGRHIQFLEVLFCPRHVHAKDGWPTFAETAPLDTSADVVATQWLGDHVIMYLNFHDELCVYDTMSRQELETIDVSSMGLVYASYRGNNGRSFANSFRACNDMLYLLGLKELHTARVQPWTQRIDTLIEDGEWLEGLGLALDHYEGLHKAAQTRAERDRFPPVFFTDRNKDQCVVDIFKMSQTNQRTGDKEDVFRHEDHANEEPRWCVGESPYPADVSKRLEAAFQTARSGAPPKNFVPIGVADRMADLLMDYVRLAMGHAPSTSLNLSHFQMLAGVAIEYCASTNRTDLLFAEIFKRFQEADKAEIFVSLLAPYILHDQLHVLSAAVLDVFVSYCLKTNQMDTVEKALLHMHVNELDFDKVIAVCHTHHLYTALIYMYNEARNDFTTPVQVLLAASASASMGPGGASGAALALVDGASEEGRLKRKWAYKLLLYLSYCFDGRSFPRRHPVSVKRMQTMVATLTQYLFEKHPKDNAMASGGDDNAVATDSIPYPRLIPLLQLDTKVFLDMIARLFDAPNVEFEGETISSNTSRYATAPLRCPPRLTMVLSLAEVLVGDSKSTSAAAPQQFPTSRFFSSADQGHFYMFEARLFSGGAIDAQAYATARSVSSTQYMMNSLMTFLATGPQALGPVQTSFEEEGFDKAGRQVMLVRLLQKLSKDSYDQATLLKSVLKEGMNRAAVLLHKDRNEFSETISAYLADTDREYKMGVFSYIRNEKDKVSGGTDGDGTTMASTSLLESSNTIETGIINHAGGLLDVDATAFVVLILENFPSLNNRIIQKFVQVGGKLGAKWEYNYLCQILGSGAEGTGEDVDMIKDLTEKNGLRMADDAAVQERYIKLLCEFDPPQVFPYLANHQAYRVDSCLKLCKEYNITDAEAYLLERTGDVTGALSLILAGLEKKIGLLRPALRGFNLNPELQSTSTMQYESSILQSLVEGQEVKSTLDVAIAMCERHSARHRDDQSEKLWFTLLDMCLKVQNTVKKQMQSKTKGRTATRGAQTVFQIAVNEMIAMILERMSSCVSLQSILFKITNEHGNDEFGDFRPTIFGMLDTYNYEHNIYKTANGMIRTDLHDQVMVLRRAQAKCIAPASIECFYCHCVLSKPPFGMSQQYNSKEKWNRHTSSVLVMATGKTFHEACGKMWQQELNSDKERPDQNRRRLSEATQEDGDDLDLEKIKVNKQGSTRRYLLRLKKMRKHAGRVTSMHHVLDSLARSEFAKNKLLRGNMATFSLKPASNPKTVRVGTRQPNQLPVKANHKGAI